MKSSVKRLRWTSAHKLMDRRDLARRPVPFSIRYITRDGRVVFLPKVVRAYSYNRLTGMRRLQLDNGGFRNVYDVLILEIDDTKIVVR